MDERQPKPPPNFHIREKLLKKEKYMNLND